MSTETEAAGLAPTLIVQFRFAEYALRKNLEGITHEESLAQPEPAGNCMNWIAGHILHSRNGILAQLDRPPVGPVDRLQRYARGSQPLKDGADALDLMRLIEEHGNAQKRIVEALERITAARLAAPLPEDRNPFRVANVGEMIATFLFHEIYHAGQLGAVRRAIGKDGAIA